MRLISACALILIILSGCVSKRRYKAALNTPGDSVSYVEKVRYKVFKVPSDSSWFYGKVICPGGAIPEIASASQKQGSVSSVKAKIDSAGNLSVICDCKEQEEQVEVIDRYYKQVKSANTDLILENSQLKNQLNKAKQKGSLASRIKGLAIAILLILLSILVAWTLFRKLLIKR
jgi:tetrahydromethanopterin S-methyltransferase subunit F